MALRPTGLCEGGEPITDEPCRKCGATEKDECGALNDQAYEVGLRLADAKREIERLRRVLHDTYHALCVHGHVDADTPLAERIAETQ